MNLSPILTKEFLSSMRGWKATAKITVYIGLLSALTYAFLSLNVRGMGTFRPEASLEIFLFLVFLKMGLIAFITPAATAGIISSEREKQTLDLLLCTPLTPLTIIMGKLISALSFIVLLIITSIPVFSIVFLFGGIKITDFLSIFLYYIVCAFTFGSLGVMCSSLFKKTQVATVATYFILFLMFAGTIIIVALFPPDINSNTPYIPPALYLNPLLGLFSLLPVYDTGPFFYGNFAQANWALKHPWIISVGLFIAISAFAIYLSQNAIQPLKENRK